MAKKINLSHYKKFHLSNEHKEQIIHFRKDIESIAKNIEALGNSISEIKIPLIEFPVLSDIIKTSEAFAKSFTRSIVPIAEEIKKGFNEFPKHVQKALITLGQHGWYLDLEMIPSELWAIERALNNDEIGEVNSILMDHIERKLDKIENSIAAKFPSRKNILTEAFNAHRRGQYALSIPVFLAQSDGICNEAVNKSLFSKHKKRRGLAEYVDQILGDSLRSAFLSPLTKTLQINASKKERNANFTGLNRHLVLHGESTDYNTKVNSYKSISLINYVFCMFEDEYTTP